MKEISLYQDIGKRIRERRKQLNLTQEQLAELIDVTPQMISTAENGSKGIRPENIIKLGKALNISCDYLLTGHSSSRDFDNLTKGIGKLSEDEIDKLIELLYLLKNISGNENIDK